MCKYRCYYYAGCQHQETILHDYCYEATSAQASSSAHTISPAATSSPSNTQTGGANEDRDATPRPRSPADITSPSPTMSTSSSHHTTASNVSIGSSAPTSFASTTEDTSDTASIQLEHPLRRHSEPTGCNMASLPPFVRDNLRHFFSGQIPTPATASLGAKHADYEDRENVQPADSAKGHDLSSLTAHTTKLIDNRLRLAAEAKSRNTSYSSITSNDSEAEFDAVERDIDDLKQQIVEMRSKSRSGRSTPTLHPGHTQSKSLSTRTRIPGPVAQPTESAAARLQREHEKAHEQHMRSVASHRAKPPPPPPSPFDFPELGQNDAERRPRAATADFKGGKPSYANMATTGMLDAISKRYTTSEDTHASKNGSNGSASRTTCGSFTSSTRTSAMAMDVHEAQHNDIETTSPKSPKCGRTSTRGQNSPLAGTSPRFAQPTKAHSQRADATARKDSVTSKVSPAGSPTKSARALPQLQTKRSALPGGWLSSPEVSPTTELSSPSITGTVDAGTPPSRERWQMIGNGSKDNASAAEPTLRKKLSSYMSPTKATTLRNVATLGQESLKHTSPRVKKHVPRIDTRVPPASETITSASSHEPESATSGTAFTETAVSSPDIEVLTESRAINLWSIRQTQAGHPNTSTDLASGSFQPTCGIATQHAEASGDTDAALSRAREGLKSAVSDPASAVFGHGGFRESSVSPGECVKTERTIQASRAHQQSKTTISPEHAVASKSAVSHAVPIVQPRVSQPKPMPHRLPASRRSTLGPLELVADDLAARAKAAGYRIPANTVAKRRVSHGHLLTPIRSKLQSLGLLKRPPDSINSPLTIQATPFSTALQHVRQMLPETPDKLLPAASPPAPAAPQVRTKAVPPHLRRKQNTSLDEEPAASKNDIAALNSSTADNCVPQGRETQNLQAQSLRATAQEFKPMWKPKTIEEELGLLDWEGWFSYRSPDEWNSLHPGIRAAIQAIRDYKCKGGRPPSGTFPGMSPTKIRSKTANQRFWAGLMQHPSPSSGSDGPANMTPGDVVAAMQQSIAQHDASGGVEAGQVLKPEINPETNALQWVMQEPDGRKVSVTFGRAAAPTAPHVAPDQFGSPSTVTISPLSNDTSLRYNESPAGQSNQVLGTPSGSRNRRAWSIASALKDPSGWAVGDGREIRYVGNGNINPGTPYHSVGPPQQGFREGPDQAPRMIGDDQEYGHSSMPLAPRSREQWAKLLPQVRKPCGNIEITHATEQIPFASMGGPKLYGFCGPCSGKTH